MRERTVPTGTFSAAGGLVVGQLAPDVQQQRVAVAAGERGEAVEELRVQVVRRVGVGRGGLRGRTAVELELAALLAAVAGDRLGGDPEQPRAGGVVARVEPVAPLERGHERLLREVLRDVGADAAGEERRDGVEVPVDDRVEAVRRAREIGRVGRRRRAYRECEGHLAPIGKFPAEKFTLARA